jgi:hypothetical protein
MDLLQVVGAFQLQVMLLQVAIIVDSASMLRANISKNQYQVQCCCAFSPYGSCAD